MDLSKGAELLFELNGKLYPAQFASFQGYYYFCITYTHSPALADESSNSTSKCKVIVTIYCNIGSYGIYGFRIISYYNPPTRHALEAYAEQGK